MLAAIESLEQLVAQRDEITTLQTELQRLRVERPIAST